MSKQYDFSGYATKYNIECKDGRTILPKCFAHQNGTRIPVVYQHNHKDVSQVIGHADLEERPDGVYAYVSLNNTENGRNAREQLMHGDYDSFSIWADELQENMGRVAHGMIKELSLVLAGANPGAKIDNVAFAHSNGFIEDMPDKAIIYSGEEIEFDEDFISHADMGNKSETVDDILNTLDADQAEAVADLLDMTEDHLKHGSIDESKYDMKKIEKSLSTLDQKQKDVVMALVGELGDTIAHDGFEEEEENDDDETEDEFGEFEPDESEDNNDEEDEIMHGNLFDEQTPQQGFTLEDANAIVHDAFANKASSLKEAFIQHDALQYGIGNIDYLFPDAKNLNVPPEFIKRDMDWVSTVLNGVHHTGFSRVKSMFADITVESARALGYIKGHLKKEEFFSLQKRVTTPQTIYKKQKLDRDDILDITDFSVVVWLKAEMRLMLNEEIARAILIGDGRSAESDDHINPEHVRPIWTDHELFTTRLQDETEEEGWDTADERAKAYIRLLIKNRKKLKGSGNPTLFITEDLLTDMLLLEDGIGHALYDTTEKLATKLRVKQIISVPVMENATRVVGEGQSAVTWQLGLIMVNLQDYNVGADKGGEINLFNDFDIDYNQEKYLMETRISGALIKPKSALVLEHIPYNVKGTVPDEEPTP